MPGSGRAQRLKPLLKQSILESESSSRIDVVESSSRRNLLKRGVSASSRIDCEVGDDTSETLSSQVNSNDGTRPLKRVRGQTRGLSFMKRRDKDFDIIISDNRIVGKDAASIITEIGIVMRDYAPFNVRKWKDVPLDTQHKMWEIIRDKFLLTDDSTTKMAIITQLNKDFRNYRSFQHVNYFKPHGTLDRALQHCPRDMDEDRWREMCLSFANEHFKKISGINANNRSKQIILHASGSKGYHRLEYELRDPVTNDPPCMRDLWLETHYNSKKKKWACEAAKIVYDEVESRINAKEEEGASFNEEDIFLEVLGHRSGYIRGRGAGPKPLSSYTRRRDAERDEEVAKARKEAEEAKKEAEEARKETSSIKEQMSLLDKKLQAFMDKVMQRGLT